MRICDFCRRYMDENEVWETEERHPEEGRITVIHCIDEKECQFISLHCEKMR